MKAICASALLLLCGCSVLRSVSDDWRRDARPLIDETLIAAQATTKGVQTIDRYVPILMEQLQTLIGKFGETLARIDRLSETTNRAIRDLKREAIESKEGIGEWWKAIVGSALSIMFWDVIKRKVGVK